ncbi:UNVERIFIED_CONTAM: hypothetical protein GTU68_051053 [Idotea baltica]|nr:hypothetical protein [Idotea baltica]
MARTRDFRPSNWRRSSTFNHYSRGDEGIEIAHASLLTKKDR